MQVKKVIFSNFYFIFLLLLTCCISLEAQIASSDADFNDVGDIKQQAIAASKICVDLINNIKDNGVQKCKDAIVLSKEAGMDSLTIINLARITNYVSNKQGVEASYEYVYEAKQIAESSDNPALKMPAYYSYALYWEKFADIESATDYLNQALEIANELDDIYYQSKLLSGIGYLFIDSELYEDAKKYFIDGLEIAKVKKDTNSIFLMESFLAISLRELGDFRESKRLYEKANTYYASINNSLAQKRIAYGLAKLEAIQNNFEASNRIILEKIGPYSSNFNSSRLTNLMLASNYFELGQYSKSLKIYKGLELNFDEFILRKNARKIFGGIGDCYAKLGRFEEATIYYQKLSNEVDGYIKEKLKKSVTTAELKYKLQSKEAENKYLASEKENLFYQNRAKTNGFLAFASMLALLAIILIYAYRKQKAKNDLLKSISLEQEKINKELLISAKQKDLLNDELESRNEELSSFAGILAHDIKAPIRTTSGFISLLKKHIQQDEKVFNYLKFIEKSNKKLSTFIDDLLSYAVSGKDEKQKNPIDLNKIITTVKSNLMHQINEKDALISSNKLPIIYSTETVMIQLFQNIITNAIKFTEKHKKPIVEVTGSTNGDFVNIQIKDNGIGMEEAYIHAIFDPLTKLNNDQEFEGSGLGLATCRKIVEHLGGRIKVSSKLDEGSTFSIVLPVEVLVNKETVFNSNSSIGSLHPFH